MKKEERVGVAGAGERGFAQRRISSRQGKRRDIQGLRAFAVLVVVLDHLLGWPTGGFAGVDIFFVISGFLITGLLLREYERTGTVSFTRFYLARIKRIIPAAMTVLMFTVIAAFVLFGSTRAQAVGWDAVWAAVFAANWNFLVAGTDYFQQDAATSPLQHFWSLSVEEQFYFVWPWLLLGLLLLTARWAWRGRVRVVAGSAIIAVIVVSFTIAMHLSVTQPVAAYFSTFARAWELGIGALLAVMVPAFGRFPQSLRVLLAYVGLATMVVSVLWIDSSASWPAPWALLPVAGASCLIASGVGTEARGNVLLTNRASVYLGDISYSLYLWHFPVIAIAPVLWPEATRTRHAVVLVIAVLLAVAAYHLIEYPLHKSPLFLQPRAQDAWRQWRSTQKRQILMGGTVGVAAVLVIGGSTAASLQSTTPELQQAAIPSVSSGASLLERDLAFDIADALNTGRWPADIEQQMSSASEWDPRVRACSDPATFKGLSCEWGDGDRLALIIGDSLAHAYVPVLKDILVPQGWRVQQMTLNGCEFNSVLLTSERSAPYCKQRVADEIAASRDLKPDAVIVTSQWAAHRVRGQETNLPFDDWWRGAKDALSRIEAPTIYVAPPPYGPSLGSCYTAVASPLDCEATVTTAWERSNDSVSALAEERQGLTYVSSRDWFCLDERCPAFARGLITRADQVHPGQQYLQSIEDVIEEDLLAALPQ